MKKAKRETVKNIRRNKIQDVLFAKGNIVQWNLFINSRNRMKVRNKMEDN